MKTTLFTASVCLAVLLAADLALAGIVQMGTGPHGTVFRKSVKSLKELRYEGIVRQKMDFSCGSAALATILKYFYGRDITEEEIVEEILKHSDREKVMAKGFSLLDLKRYADSKGFKAEGYKVGLEQLPKIKIPTIVLVDVNGYEHFVVLKGVRRQRVFLADPMYGKRVVSLREFSESWNEIVFAVFGKRSPDSTYEGPQAIGASKDGIWRIRDVGLGSPLLHQPFEIKR
jgi:hypothetical protein